MIIWIIAFLYVIFLGSDIGMGEKRKNDAACSENKTQRPSLHRAAFKQACTTILFQRPEKKWRSDTAPLARPNSAHHVVGSFQTVVGQDVNRCSSSEISGRKESRRQRRIRKGLTQPNESCRQLDVHHTAVKATSLSLPEIKSLSPNSTPKLEDSQPKNSRPCTVPTVHFKARVTSVPLTANAEWSRDETQKSLNAFIGSSSDDISDKSDESDFDSNETPDEKKPTSGSFTESFAAQIRSGTEQSSSSTLITTTDLPKDGTISNESSIRTAAPNSIEVELEPPTAPTQSLSFDEDDQHDNESTTPRKADITCSVHHEESASSAATFPVSDFCDDALFAVSGTLGRSEEMFSQAPAAGETPQIVAIAGSFAEDVGNSEKPRSLQRADVHEEKDLGSATDASNTTSATLRRANVGVKRMRSSSESCDASVPGPSATHNPACGVSSSEQAETSCRLEEQPAQEDPCSDLQAELERASDEDLYAMVNQVACDVLTTTRPLPSCKHGPLSFLLANASIQRATHNNEHSDNNIAALSATTADKLAHTLDTSMRVSDDDSLSISSLSELSRSPSPPDDLPWVPAMLGRRGHTLTRSIATIKSLLPPASQRKKRKMTGVTSRHFSRSNSLHDRTLVGQQINCAKDDMISLELTTETEATCTADDATQTQVTARKVKAPRRTRKSTGKVSDHFSPRRKIDESLLDRVDLYNTTSSSRRVPAGTSTCPVPSINADKFGIVQERLWPEPFWLIVAVVFLNQTTGRAAMPTFWQLKKKYPTMHDLAAADQIEVMKMIQHLGLQNIRSRRVIEIAKTWIEKPPCVGRRFRTLNYPEPGDGKQYKPGHVDEEDAAISPGALEIGHIPGCKQYAYDSWRIFCRDVLRGVASDYKGRDAEDASFVPEWQRVLPKDKELRACVRWLWLKEGWIWDPLTGEKRPATPEEVERAVQGEMEIPDAQERKFAAQAAGVEKAEKLIELVQTNQEKEDVVLDAPEDWKDTIIPLGADVGNEDCQINEGGSADEGDNIIVMPRETRARTRTRNL